MLEKIREDAFSGRPGRSPQAAEPLADFALIADQPPNPAVGAVGGEAGLRALPCRQHLAVQARPCEQESAERGCRYAVSGDE